MSVPKISGEYVEAFLASAGEVSSVFEEKAKNILKENGIGDVESGDWFPMSSFSDAIVEIEETVGEKTSEQAGIEMVEIVEEVSDMESMEEAVEVGEELHRQSYKNFSTEAVGNVKCEQMENGNSKIAYYGGWEFPEAFTRGIFKGYAKGVRDLTTDDIELIEPEGDEVYAAEVYE